jgi:hypothetical protein
LRPFREERAFFFNGIGEEADAAKPTRRNRSWRIDAMALPARDGSAAFKGNARAGSTGFRVTGRAARQAVDGEIVQVREVEKILNQLAR